MKIAMLSLADPWAHAHGGTLRTRGFLQAFTELGHDVVCVFPSRLPATKPGSGRSVAVATAPIGMHPLLGSVRRAKRLLLPMPTAIGARSRALADAVIAERPDVVAVSTLAQAAYADAVPTARLWLDMSDLWSEFARREAMTRRGVARRLALLQQRQIERTETARVAAAAFVTAAGYTDAAILTERAGTSVSWLPTPLQVHPVPLPEPLPKCAGFIANFAFGPNADAWQVLATSWLPRLRERGWDVVVAGLGSDLLPALPGVVRLGPVDDVAEFYREISVTLAPIRLGGGMKVKVAESLLAGRPVIASRFAVDGFPPAIRALTHVVDLDDPDLDGLDEIASVVPPAAELSVFGTDHFWNEVSRLLNGLG
ncbi:MAG: glycosyltransferase family 4 protein [Actinomycetota bacterium]